MVLGKPILGFPPGQIQKEMAKPIILLAFFLKGWGGWATPSDSQ